MNCFWRPIILNQYLLFMRWWFKKFFDAFLRKNQLQSCCLLLLKCKLIYIYISYPLQRPYKGRFWKSVQKTACVSENYTKGHLWKIILAHFHCNLRGKDSGQSQPIYNREGNFEGGFGKQFTVRIRKQKFQKLKNYPGAHRTHWFRYCL